jgi:hypothetical protein
MLANNTTSHGVAWSHLDEQIHTDSRTSDDFRPHFASIHADFSPTSPCPSSTSSRTRSKTARSLARTPPSQTPRSTSISSRGLRATLIWSSSSRTPSIYGVEVAGHPPHVRGRGTRDDVHHYVRRTGAPGNAHHP